MSQVTVKELVCALEFLVECVEPPPEPNCTCHINPPCGDCVEYSGLREALQEAEALIEQHKSDNELEAPRHGESK